MNGGRVVAITGAARGIGRATAVAFARAGYRVVGADIAARASAAMVYEPATPEDASDEARMVSGTSFAATGGDSANITA